MTTAQQELLQLIRCNIWSDGEVSQASENVLAEVRKQALVPLVAPESSEAAYSAAHAICLLYVQDELLSAFKAAGITSAILKGTAAAIYYSDPLRRTMGDIDLMVPPDAFEKAQYLMEQSGCERESKEPDQEDSRHIGYRLDGVTIELHRRFSHEGIDVERYVLRGLTQSVVAELDGHRFPMLPPMENGLVLLAHVAQHLRNGLGLRQMIDWMMYVHAQLSDEYWKSTFCPVATDCGLETLAITATRLCKKFLGLPDPVTWCDGADEKLVDDLLENLLVTGNFGHIHGSGSSVETVATNIKRTGLFRYLQQQGEHNWKAYQEHKALKPLCWAYQIGRYIHRGLGTGRSSLQLAEDYSRSRTRYDLLTRLGID